MQQDSPLHPHTRYYHHPVMAYKWPKQCMTRRNEWKNPLLFALNSSPATIQLPLIVLGWVCKLQLQKTGPTRTIIIVICNFASVHQVYSSIITRPFKQYLPQAVLVSFWHMGCEIRITFCQTIDCILNGKRYCFSSPDPYCSSFLAPLILLSDSSLCTNCIFRF